MKLNFTGNPRAVQIIIAALLVLTSWFGCRQAKAEEPEQRFFASGGQMWVTTNFRASQSLRVGMESGPWQASIVTHGDETFRNAESAYHLDPNIGACGTWHKGLDNWSIGWGACLWDHGDFAIGDKQTLYWDGSALALDDDGVQLTAAIIVRRTFGKRDRLYAELFHASTGGSTHYNRGKNMVYIGVRM